MADKASKAGEQTGGGGTGIEAPIGAPAVAGQDESVAIGSAGADPVVPGDQDDDPVDPKVMTTSRFAKKHPTLHDPNLAKPNSPAFDYDRKSGKPRLADGETVIAEATKHGVLVAVTNHGRKIFCCTLDKYEAAFGQLPNRKLYERFFPDAK